MTKMVNTRDGIDLRGDVVEVESDQAIDFVRRFRDGTKRVVKTVYKRGLGAACGFVVWKDGSRNAHRWDVKDGE